MICIDTVTGVDHERHDIIRLICAVSEAMYAITEVSCSFQSRLVFAACARNTQTTKLAAFCYTHTDTWFRQSFIATTDRNVK